MAYIGPSIETGFRQRFVYTATAGQTSFSGSDSVGISLTYTDSEYLDVYQNGVLLVPGSDYAATTGTTVVLVTGASLNDKVEMIAYQAFGVADTVSRADGGAFGGNVAVTGDVTASDDFLGSSHLKIGTTTDPSAGGSRIVSNVGGGSFSQFHDSNNDKGAVFGTVAGASQVYTYAGAVGSETYTLRQNITADGEMTMPTQPVFQAIASAAQSNMAHDATIVLGSETFDVGSNFASNTFTAPVTGKYQLNASLRLENVDSATTYVYLQLPTSNRNYINVISVPRDHATSPSFDLGFWNLSISVIADMDANDTALMKFGYSGGAQQVDTSANGGTSLSGALIC